MADTNDEGSSPKRSGGGESPPFADFSSFREMIREEREAARVERKVTAAEARVEREMAAVEKRHFMASI